MAITKAFPQRPKTGQDLGELEGWLDLIWKLLKSDVYSPTLTNVTNLDGSTSRNCPYVRLGNIVIVGLSFSADPTAAAPTDTELGVSLPIATTFSGQYQLTGCVVGAGSQVGKIEADTTNHRAKVEFSATVSADRAWNGIFVYQLS